MSTHIRPDGAFNPRKTLYSVARSTPLKEAVGLISCQNVDCYPPGVPIVAMGSEITSEQVAATMSAREWGANVVGIDLKNPLIRTVDCTDSFLDPRTRAAERDYSIETFPEGQLPEELKNAYPDLYREIFSNDPYHHFCFNESDPIAPAAFSCFADVNNNAEAYWRLDQLDAIKLPVGHRRWMDPDICKRELRSRLSEGGYFTALIQRSTSELSGFIHLRIATLRRIFETEELCDPLLFSGFDSPRFLVNQGDFYRKMRFHFGLFPDDLVAFVSSQGIRPRFRGLIFEMMSDLARRIVPEHEMLPVLAEIPNSGAGRAVNVAANERVIHGILPNGDDLVYSSRLAHAMRFYEGTRARFGRAVRQQLLTERRTTHYPHTSDNPDVEVRETPARGRGVFATDQILAGDRIAVFLGEDYEAESALSVPLAMRDHCIQIGENLFRHAAGRLAELLNHSCEPNCGIRGDDEIFALRNITAGEELCWDYRMTEDSDWVLEDCLCGAKRCTGVVAGFSSLTSDRQKEYLCKKAVSNWICKARGVHA